MVESVTIGDATLYCGDCRDVLPTLPAVDCVITDPPYFKVKGDYWDNEWDKPAEFLAWMRGVLGLLADRMKPNGSAYVFASPQMAARVEVAVRERLNVLGHIVWNKGARRKGAAGSGVDVTSLRTYWQASSERIVFAERAAEGDRPAYSEILKAARSERGLGQAELCGLLGLHGAVNRGGAVANWELGLNAPSEQQWQLLCSVLPLPPYDDAVRSFSLSDRDQWGDVWDFEPVSPYQGKHPCEKPVLMLSHMLNASTKPGALVLDAFMGSGATGDACLQMGRRFIGIERDREHFESACRRLRQQQAQERLFA